MHNKLQKRRKRRKFLIFKQCGFHSLEILVAPERACACKCGWLTVNSFCVTMSLCFHLLVYVCFLMWFRWTEKQAFKFYRENLQIPKRICNYKQDKTSLCVSMCDCVRGLKPNMFYEFRRQSNYKFLPQLKETGWEAKTWIVWDLHCWTGRNLQAPRPSPPTKKCQNWKKRKRGKKTGSNMRKRANILPWKT